MRELFVREIHILLIHPIYLICMVVMPLFVTFFFTSLMDEGVPTDIPIGIVDLDQTTTTRKLTRMVDAFQSTKVAAHYPTMAEARHAIQQNEIYGFILFPKDMTSDMLAFRQPKMSFYYSNTSMTAGSLIYKDMKTVCTLAAAGVGQGV
ncbi:MAG: ABC transporter permease, partial [Prevotella sp.]|nr:ABC transporter permease [Prevotella sp.]